MVAAPGRNQREALTAQNSSEVSGEESDNENSSAAGLNPDLGHDNVIELEEINIHRTSNTSNNTDHEAALLPSSSSSNSMDSGYATNAGARRLEGGRKVLEYTPERLKTLAAFGILTFGGFCNFLALTIIHDLTPDKPLPDLALDLLPQYDWAWRVGDALNGIIVGLAAACVVFHKRRWIVLRRCLFLGGVMYILRAVCMAVTLMPPSWENLPAVCLPKLNSTFHGPTIGKRLLDYIVTFGLTSGEEDGQILCGDLMFSGHTSIFTLSYFTILMYTPRKFALFRWAMYPVCYFGISCLILSSGHYTIDVLIAYWLASHLWWSYHQLFETLPKHRLPRLRSRPTRFLYFLRDLFGLVDPRRERRVPCTRLWWFWAANWLESNVPEGPIPNELEFPLPWPRLCVDTIEKLSRWANKEEPKCASPPSEEATHPASIRTAETEAPANPPPPGGPPPPHSRAPSQQSSPARVSTTSAKA